MDSYDLVVIGSGPAGQKAAIAASKLGYRAAIVDRGNMMGGVCINTGTIPSKTLREAVLYLTGLSQRELYGQAYRVKQDITISDVSSRIAHVVNREIDVIRNQLARNHVAMLVGTASTIRAPAPGSTATSSSSASAPSRRGRRRSSSTGKRLSIPTRSSAWTRCRRRWWWSAPG